MWLSDEELRHVPWTVRDSGRSLKPSSTTSGGLNGPGDILESARSRAQYLMFQLSAQTQMHSSSERRRCSEERYGEVEGRIRASNSTRACATRYGRLRTPAPLMGADPDIVAMHEVSLTPGMPMYLSLPVSHLQMHITNVQN